MITVDMQSVLNVMKVIVAMKKEQKEEVNHTCVFFLYFNQQLIDSSTRQL